MFYKLLTVWTLGFLFLLEGCNYPKEFTDFYNLPGEKQIEVLKSLPIDKQIDFHLYAMSREPPDRRFAEDIALQGDKIIPDVLRRFKEENEDYNKNSILEIFYELCRKQKCSESHPEVIRQIEEEITKMKDAGWQKTAQIYLPSIKGESKPFTGQPPPPPTPPPVTRISP
jgi:hypothetical protein